MALQDDSLQQLSTQAKQEIGEVNAKDKLTNLKNVLLASSEKGKYEDLQLPPDFDDFLLRCLRVRKFDVARSAKLVSQYFKVNRELADMHDCLLPSLYKDLYNTFGVAVLKNRDSQGRAVILARQELVPPALYSFDESLAGSLLILDEAVRSSVDTQRLGVVFICDWKGYSLSHFRQTSPSRLRSAAKLFQDAFPARFKAFHFIRNPLLVSCMYAVVKPFLREKIKNRVHFHGHDFDSFQKHVSPEILPQFLGGDLPNDEYADLDLTSRLIERDEYYRDLYAHGYPQN